MMDLSRGGTVTGGALIIAGTTIGAGMLALPLLTAFSGFFPSILIYLACWLFMTATGLLFMEMFLWSKEEVNIVSMAKMTLGSPGKIIAWFLYLYLFYSLTVAYTSLGGNLVQDLFEGLGQMSFTWVGPLVFIVIFAPLVAIGAKVVDRINFVFMGGLVLSFLVFVVLGINKIEVNLLLRADWSFTLLAVPVVFTAFGFQGTVPTLTNYLDRDSKKASKAIVIGSTIPLIVYILWQALILGIVPLEEVKQAISAGQSSIAPLKNQLNHPWFFLVGEFFAFFAVVTSFLGMTLGFFDFLADGLKVKKDVKGRFLLSLLVFGPPLVFAMFNPSLFLQALQYGGGLGCALLLGVLPILMVWRGRYTLKYKGEFTLFGGRWVLTLLLLFVTLEILLIGFKFIVD
ncbi:MAG: aromatic amino acid transport family protein [Chlamydiales bacterium]